MAVFCRRPVRSRLSFFAIFFSLFAYGQTVGTCRETISVDVRDHEGHLVPNLKSSSFLARLQSEPVKVLDAKGGNLPARVLVMLDASGSMANYKPKWDVARQLAANMLVSLPPATQVGMVVFARHIVETVAIKHTPYEIVERLKGLGDPKKIVPPGDSHTALIDSLLKAVSLLGTPEPGDSIFIVSDGGENRSDANWTKAKKALLAHRIRLFAVILHDSYMWQQEQDGEWNLRSTAEETGGRVIYNHGPEILSEKSLIAESDALYHQISQYYALELETPFMPSEVERKFDLDIVDENQRRIEGYRVTHPQKLVGCLADKPASTLQPVH